jgi:hypothetical protein
MDNATDVNDVRHDWAFAGDLQSEFHSFQLACISDCERVSRTLSALPHPFHATCDMLGEKSYWKLMAIYLWSRHYHPERWSDVVESAIVGITCDHLHEDEDHEAVNTFTEKVALLAKVRGNWRAAGEHLQAMWSAKGVTPQD